MAILCPRSKKNSTLADTNSIQGIKLTTNLTLWKDDNGILYSTIRSFKGLEVDAVILLDLSKPGSIPQFSENDFYVGRSRAKHLLAVIISEKELVNRIK